MKMKEEEQGVKGRGRRSDCLPPAPPTDIGEKETYLYQLQSHLCKLVHLGSRQLLRFDDLGEKSVELL